MPGVPAEMEAMFTQSVLPRLVEQASGKTVVRHVNLGGVPESRADAALRDLLEMGRNPSVGLKAGGGWVAVCIRARGPTVEEARALAEADCRVVQERFGDAVFGYDDETHASALAAACRARRLTLAVAESCTGGLIGNMLTDVPGVSDVFLLDVVAYDNAAKSGVLGVSEEQIKATGAVSREVAALMAEGVCRAAGADVGVSTTGIAGPAGGSAEKPVGLVYVGVSVRGRTTVDELRLSGDRWRVKDRAARHALNAARVQVLAQGRER